MQKLYVFRGNRKLGHVFSYASDDAKRSNAKAKAVELYGAGVFLRDADV